MASMVFDEGDEEKDDAFDDPEIEMNIRDAGGARTRSSNVEGPVVANSGAEDFAKSNQQREGVMTHVGTFSIPTRIYPAFESPFR